MWKTTNLMDQQRKNSNIELLLWKNSVRLLHPKKTKSLKNAIKVCRVDWQGDGLKEFQKFIPFNDPFDYTLLCGSGLFTVHSVFILFAEKWE